MCVFPLNTEIINSIVRLEAKRTSILYLNIRHFLPSTRVLRNDIHFKPKVASVYTRLLSVMSTRKYIYIYIYIYRRHEMKQKMMLNLHPGDRKCCLIGADSEYLSNFIPRCRAFRLIARRDDKVALTINLRSRQAFYVSIPLGIFFSPFAENIFQDCTY